MSSITGTLYGIGVGPGDPELIPLKSVRILQEVDVIFTAASSKNEYSLAVTIAQPHLPETTDIKTLPFPMTKDPGITQQAWEENTGAIIAELEAGRDVAFLTLGDPLTYSTYGYILRNIQKLAPHLTAITIPGITSFQAAAARLNRPLVEGEESLLLTSGAFGGHQLRRLTEKLENVIFLKAYRNVRDITAALEEADMLENSVAISKCSREDEKIVENVMDLCDQKPDYWTLILAKHKKKPGNEL